MTLNHLLTDLDSTDANARLVFHYHGQAIGAGYHVTELRHTASTGIDCSGAVERTQDARLQLLDGHGVTHMAVGKFRSILKASLAKVPDLADVPLVVEFAPGNAGLRLLQVSGRPTDDAGQVTLTLEDLHAECKPAARAQAACCG